MAGVSAKHHFSRVSITFVVAGFTFLSSSLFAQEILVDRMIAEVNGEAITYSEVLSKIRRGNLVEVAAFPAKEDDPEFDIALQDIVNKKLIIQRIDDAGIEVSDESVELEIDSFLRKKGLTRQGLIEALKGEGLSFDQYFSDFKNQMLIKQFQGRFIVPAVKISEKDIELYYFQMLGSSPEGVKVRLRQIYISTGGVASEKVLRAKQELVQEVYLKLKNGMDFVSAVEVYSNAPGAQDNGGLMPVLSLKDLSPVIAKAIESLKKNEYSQPVKVGGGFYIFYLDDKFLSDTADFEKHRKGLELRLRQKEMQNETLKWLSHQRDIGKIRILR